MDAKSLMSIDDGMRRRKATARKVQERGMFVPRDRAQPGEKRPKGLPDPGERELFPPARGGGLGWGRSAGSHAKCISHFDLHRALPPPPPPSPARGEGVMFQ